MTFTYFYENYRNVLSSEILLNFLREKNFIVWAGDIKESEAFLGTTILIFIYFWILTGKSKMQMTVSNVLLATRYPFTALIAPQASRMVVVDRVEGIMTTETFIAQLSQQIHRMDPVLISSRADRYVLKLLIQEIVN